jgi:hypothetical protein
MIHNCDHTNYIEYVRHNYVHVNKILHYLW